MTTVTCHQHDHCLIITLNRPTKRNALNPELIHTMRKALSDHQENRDIRSIILQGTGDHFCAGADIQHMQSLIHATPEENLEDAKNLAELLWQLYTFPKPIIALTHGAAIGGGVGLLAASDIVLAASNATFAFSEVKLGVIPAIISPYIMRAIGNRAMHRYFLTAEQFNATCALQLGLVHDIITDQTLLDAGLLLANTIARNGPHAITAAKMLIAEIEKKPFDYTFALNMAEQLATIRQSKEAQTGFRAFTEKRHPNWSE